MLIRCYVWSIALYGSETWKITKLELKYLESFEMWCWSRMEKIKWSEKVTSGDVKGIYSTHRDPSVLYVFKYVN
jgi:hypothetical protein